MLQTAGIPVTKGRLFKANMQLSWRDLCLQFCTTNLCENLVGQGLLAIWHGFELVTVRIYLASIVELLVHRTKGDFIGRTT